MKYVALIAFMVLFFGFAIWVKVGNYHECRYHGFSVGYCMNR